MTIELERRAFVQSGAALAAGAAFAAATQSAAAQTPTASPGGAKPMTYSVKPLPFDPTKIKGLSEKILVSHYENSGQTAQLDHRAAGRARLRQSPRFPDQRAEARGVDRDKFYDLA
jgi:hypothetical protein